MLLAELLAAFNVVVDVMVVRPGRQDGDLFGRDRLGLDALRHELIESYNHVGLIKAVLQHPLQAARGTRAGLHAAGSERLVGVEIHDPKDELPTLDASKECTQPRNERWGRHSDH